MTNQSKRGNQDVSYSAYQRNVRYSRPIDYCYRKLSHKRKTPRTNLPYISWKLELHPHECIHCNYKVASDIIRWGTTTVRLLMHNVSEYRAYLELKKQRFKCKACHRTFVADTSVAKKHCFISEKVRWPVVTRLKKNTSMTEIATQKNLSVSSVYRIMKRFYRPLNPFRTTIPKVLCFDEFKSVKGVLRVMGFIMMDGKTHLLLDIVENRQLPYLERYFCHFP